MNLDLILAKFEAMKHKNQYSKYKNAFLKFCQFQSIKLDNDFYLKLNLLKLDKKKKRRNLKEVQLKDIKNHLRVIKDKKLKLSYETMLATGLRVSELSQIKKEDCKVETEIIELSFIGKGGKQESVTIFAEENKKLFDDLQALINSSEKKVFYSANHLQKKAIEKGFQCHDLRRAFAKIEYKKTKDIKHTQEALRHTNEKNTKIYLRSKIKI